MECLTVTFDILRRIAKYLAHPTRQYNKRFKALSKRISETLLDDASLSLDPFAVVVAYLLELVPKMPVASLCLPILQCVVQYQETLRIVDPRKCADVAKVADACAVLLSNEWPDAKRLQVCGREIEC